MSIRKLTFITYDNKTREMTGTKVKSIEAGESSDGLAYKPKELKRLYDMHLTYVAAYPNSNHGDCLAELDGRLPDVINNIKAEVSDTDESFYESKIFPASPSDKNLVPCVEGEDPIFTVDPSAKVIVKGILISENGGPFKPAQEVGYRVTLQPEEIPDAISNMHKELAAEKETGGLKYDGGKVPLDLLDMYALEETAKVLQFGASKYAPHNWRKGIKVSRLVAAAMRHTLAFNNGETLDPETGLPHMAHAMCCNMFILWTIKNRPDLDDRWQKDTQE